MTSQKISPSRGDDAPASRRPVQKNRPGLIFTRKGGDRENLRVQRQQDVFARLKEAWESFELREEDPAPAYARAQRGVKEINCSVQDIEIFSRAMLSFPRPLTREEDKKARMKAGLFLSALADIIEDETVVLITDTRIERMVRQHIESGTKTGIHDFIITESILYALETLWDEIEDGYLISPDEGHFARPMDYLGFMNKGMLTIYGSTGANLADLMEGGQIRVFGEVPHVGRVRDGELMIASPTTSMPPSISEEASAQIYYNSTDYSNGSGIQLKEPRVGIAPRKIA